MRTQTQSMQKARRTHLAGLSIGSYLTGYP